jgi:hypothetical protein
MKALIVTLLGMLVSSTLLAAKSESLAFKRKHKLALNIVSIANPDASGFGSQTSRTGVSYLYDLDKDFAIGGEILQGSNSQGQGTATLDMDYTDIFVFGQMTIPNYTNIGVFGGLGLHQEKVSQKLTTNGSGAEASEWRGFYGFGANFKFSLAKLFKSYNPLMQRLEYEMSLTFRGEFANSDLSVTSYKLFGLGYRF